MPRRVALPLLVMLVLSPRVHAEDKPEIGMPVLERMLAVPLVEKQAYVRDVVQKVVGEVVKNDEAVVPGFHPIVAIVPKAADPSVRIPIVCYRSYWGLNAHDLAGRKVSFKAPMERSTERMLNDPSCYGALATWIDGHVGARRGPIVFENSLIGSLSHAGGFVYAVDDLAVPPPLRLDDSRLNPRFSFDGRISEKMKDALRHSKLRAFSMWSGKLAWEQGDMDNRMEDKQLSDTFFLGPPLVQKDGLWVFTQAHQQFRLVMLNPATGKLLAIIPLGRARNNMIVDPLRRIEAVHLAHSDGILACANNQGTLFGVDLAAGKLKWSYVYRREPADDFIGPLPEDAPPPVLTNPTWKSAAPVIHDGKVVFTAPDADAVHCVDLRTGKPLWIHNRHDDDVYFAGIGGETVLIVGKKTMRGLSPDKGETVWTLDTGTPSGRGAISEAGRYFLPLASSAKDKKPGIAVVEPKTGKLITLVASPKGDVPGNLVFFEGMLISQTATELVVYPLAK